MGVIGIVGTIKQTNNVLLALALNQPTLFIDCTNCANPHRLADQPFNKLEQFHVVPAESLYRFKPTIESLDKLAKECNANIIIISAFSHLFNYDDKKENNNIYEYAWKKLKQSKYQIFAGIERRSSNEKIARQLGIPIKEAKYMGHTSTSQRMVADKLLSELQAYIRSLPKSEQETAKELLNHPLQRLGSISYASSTQTWAMVLFTMLCEHQKHLDEIQELLPNRRVSQTRLHCVVGED